MLRRVIGMAMRRPESVRVVLLLLAYIVGGFRVRAAEMTEHSCRVAFNQTTSKPTATYDLSRFFAQDWSTTLIQDIAKSFSYTLRLSEKNGSCSGKLSTKGGAGYVWTSDADVPPYKLYLEDWAAGVLAVELTFYAAEVDKEPDLILSLQCGAKDEVFFRPLEARHYVNGPDQLAQLLTLSSALFCPTECPRSGHGDLLCSGHGLCGLDMSLSRFGTSHCHCHRGWTGSDCGTRYVKPHARSATPGVVALVFVLMAALVVLVVLTFKVLRRLNTDDVRYNKLAATDAGREPDPKDLGDDLSND